MNTQRTIIFENEYGKWYPDNSIELSIDFKDFDISHETYFYLKNHPEDELAPIKDKFYEHIYAKVAEKCNESGEYTIDCFQDHYTVRKISEIEQIHYDAMSDEEKAKHDLEKKKNAIESEVFELKDYLNSSDYIISKLNELSVDGTQEELAEAKEQYAEQLAKRKESRARINELEEELKSLDNEDF